MFGFFKKKIGDLTLMWEKDSREMNWDDAMEYAKNLRQGGYDDWRLPTIDELKLIIEGCGGIAVTDTDSDSFFISKKNEANESYQENYKAKGFASKYYWSSTTSGDRACIAGFRNGDLTACTDKNSSEYVRCVRSRQ